MTSVDEAQTVSKEGDRGSTLRFVRDDFGRVLSYPMSHPGLEPGSPKLVTETLLDSILYFE